MRRDEFYKNTTFCAIPWVNSSVNSAGYFRVCCVCCVAPFGYPKDENDQPFNAKDSLNPRNNKVYREMRVAMLSNVKHPLCEQCWDREEKGIMSSRYVNSCTYYPEIIEKAERLTKKDGSINEEDFPVAYYDLRLGNLCNAKCVMCGNTSSSMWNNNVVIDWSEGGLDTPFLNELIENLENVDRIYLTGGEPTINKNQWRLLEAIIDNGHSNHIHLTYNTNCRVFEKYMFEIWGHFGSVAVGFSIDGIGKVLEKIRPPTKWSEVEKNILMFERESHPNTSASFAMTIHRDSVLSALDLFKWYSPQKFKKIRLHPHLNILYTPPHFNVRNLHPIVKEKVKKEYEKFYKWLDENLDLANSIHCRNTFKGVVNTMMGKTADIEEIISEKASKLLFKKPKKFIVHGSHHRSLTNLFANVLNGVGRDLGLKFEINTFDTNPDIYLEDHSRFNFESFPPFVGSHAIRDPRDMIVSGYFYHLNTNEKWAKEPGYYKNLSYQEYINKTSMYRGIREEIKRSTPGIKEMTDWDFDNPSFIEIRYEDLIMNEGDIFYEIFKHYGFTDLAIERSLRIVKKFTIDNPGKPGKWKDYFDEEHKEVCKELLGDCLIKLGYEKNNDW